MSKKSKKSEALQLRGKILSFNTSRKGCIDGALLENEAGISQVNFRKSDGRSLAETMTIGNTVELTVELESGNGLHPVYVLHDEAAQASGEVVRLNYAPRGELNGYHLDDGTFVHVRSRDAKRILLTVGARVKAVGPRHVGTDVVVLKARTLERLDAAAP